MPDHIDDYNRTLPKTRTVNINDMNGSSLKTCIKGYRQLINSGQGSQDIIDSCEKAKKRKRELNSAEISNLDKNKHTIDMLIDFRNESRRIRRNAQEIATASNKLDQIRQVVTDVTDVMNKMVRLGIFII